MGDWSALPRDFLCLVSDRFALVDYVRFGAVCVSWRQSVAGRRSHPPLRPQSPWITSLARRDGGEPTALEIFCLADKRPYRLDLPVSDPPIRHRFLIASVDGWLVTADELSELHMLNPLTGLHARLPSILTLVDVDAVRDADGNLTGYSYQDPSYPWDYLGLEQALEQASQMFYGKFELSHPSSSSDWTAVLVHNHCHLSFARAGDSAWTILYDGPVVHDVVYHDGRFFVMHGDESRTITAWDLSPSARSPRATPLWALLIHPTYHTLEYLVESGDDLLLVSRKLGCTTSYTVDVGFDVFRLDEREQEWIGMESLGERALFVGRKCSMSLSAVEYPELKANCIYFTRPYYEELNDRETRNWGEHDIGVFNLEDESMDLRHYDYRNWPHPTWFMPRLFNAPGEQDEKNRYEENLRQGFWAGALCRLARIIFNRCGHLI